MKQVSQVPCLGFEDDHCHTFPVQLPRDSRPVSGDDSWGASHLPSSHHHQLQVYTWQQLVGNFYNLNQNCVMPTTSLLSSYYYCKIIIISLLSTACSSVNFLVYYMASGRALSSLIPSVRRRSRYPQNSKLGIISYYFSHSDLGGFCWKSKFCNPNDYVSAIPHICHFFYTSKIFGE